MLTYPGLFLRNRLRALEKNFPVLILSYQVITVRAQHVGLSKDHFLRHVRFLKEHYRIASLPDALEMLKKGNIDTPVVVVTFEDSDANNFLGPRAIIEPENIPVTFVCARHVTANFVASFVVER